MTAVRRLRDVRLRTSRQRPRLPRPPGALVAAVAAALAVQRLALPGSQIPLLLPLVAVGVAVGLHRGVLVFDTARLRLHLLAVACVTASTVIAFLRGLSPSLPSVLLLVGMYALGTVVLAAPTWAAYRTLLTALVRVMTAYAALGATLFAAQWAGLGYRDWLGEVVPGPFLLQGFYTTNPLAFGSPYSRANGLVFLEPSLFSLFCGLALAAALFLRTGVLTLGVLAVGLMTSVSGNGMVVAGAAVLVLVLTRQWGSLRPLVLPAVAGAGAVLAFGLAPTLIERVTEVADGDSSASLRFVQPYALFARQLLSDPVALLLGRGAGSADSFAATVRATDLQAPVLPKVVFEYGLVAAVPLVALLLALTLSRVPTPALAAGLAVVYWVVNASLLVPLLVVTVLAFVSWWAPRRERPLPGVPVGTGARVPAPPSG